MKRVKLDIAGKSDPGCVRRNNEDSLAVDETLGLLIVADGMGGHNSGEVASRLATETILDFGRKMMGGAKQLLPEGGNPSRSARTRQLEYFVKTANTIIYEKARAFPQDQGMGTTVVAVSTDGRTCTVAHVGDSRLYFLRNGRLQAMTQDHSLVMDQVRRGLISPEQAEKSGMQNILTRALGTEPEVAVDVEEHPVLTGDVLLLCTDGLTKMVPEAKIERLLAEPSGAADCCDRLISEARAAGGVDNVTVIVAKAGAGGGRGVRGLLDKILGGQLRRAMEGGRDA